MTGRPVWLVGCLMLLCLALAGIELALVRSNRELRAQVTELREEIARTEQPQVRALEGRPFPTQELFDAQGARLGLAELADTHATLLLVSSPACDYCAEARPVWERAARRLSGTPVRVLELVLEPSPDAGGAHSAPFPQLSAGDAEELLLRSMPGLPAALLLDSRGVVQHAIYGAEMVGLEQLLNGHLEHLALIGGLSGR